MLNNRLFPAEGCCDLFVRVHCDHAWAGPLQPPPLQPKNWKFLFWGVAVNVTTVPTV